MKPAKTQHKYEAPASQKAISVMASLNHQGVEQQGDRRAMLLQKFQSEQKNTLNGTSPSLAASVGSALKILALILSSAFVSDCCEKFSQYQKFS